MKKYYRIVDSKQESGIGEYVPDGFTVYETEPQELIDILALEKQEQDLISEVNIAKQYLSETSWIWEKYSRNVTVLGDLTNEEFKLKYADIILKQEEAKALINVLEVKIKVQ